MNKKFIGIISIAVFLVVNGCSNNTDPEFRIVNEQSSKVNLKIQTSGISKSNIIEIGAGQTTAYQTTSAGNITVTDITHNESVSFLSAKSTRYTILINTNKPLSVNPDK
ncbi:MAG: hypothetical protein CVV24_04640 [Ignavibacteriae bacterium HGW-Ignavibacteriae-3]|nr:MAG: hypothetical protein CVV24_04640 [Ignavibacteriae bacterium HGW-Ignavibacteriae-3]